MSCDEQGSYLIVHAYLRAVSTVEVSQESGCRAPRRGAIGLFTRTQELFQLSMHIFCLIWIIVSWCGCRLRSLIYVCWVMLSAVWKDCVRVNFVFWGTEGESVPCFCFIRFITADHPMHE